MKELLSEQSVTTKKKLNPSVNLDVEHNGSRLKKIFVCVFVSVHVLPPADFEFTI